MVGNLPAPTVLVLLASALVLVSAVVPTPAAKHNVLMIASDDMRPEMSPYGHKYMNTPNFQGLADDG